MAHPEKLLIVDDEETILQQLKWAFKSDFDIFTATESIEAIKLVASEKPGIMLLDLCLSKDPSKLEGFDVLEEVKKIDPLIKVIVVTGHDEKENALKAIERGAYDFYTKPISIDEMKIILSRASKLITLEEELEELKRAEWQGHEFEGIIAISPPMLEVFKTVEKVAPTDVTVLITGESGTGKELVAKAIHNKSTRKNKPFVAINCGAIPENLLESELFGHEKGSFTGAHISREGRFETANGGTIFLDEIGELSPNLQVKILRFLQDHVIERVGGREPIPVDVRIVAATNRDLESMIAEGKFREDLYYRINTIGIKLPPLRDRGDDILVLAMRFLHRYNHEFSRRIKGFSEKAIEAIYKYSWPGNVRELENKVKRGVIMASSSMIEPEDLDISLISTSPESAKGESDKNKALDESLKLPSFSTLKEARDEVEKRMVIRSLVRTGGNISASAKMLAISRPALHDLLKKHGINPDSFRMKNTQE